MRNLQSSSPEWLCSPFKKNRLCDAVIGGNAQTFRPRGKSSTTPYGSSGKSARLSQTVKPIEALEVDNLVWAWDEAKGAVVRRRVKRLFRHKHKAVLDVICVISGTRCQQTISATTEHPFWVNGKGWVPSCRLQPDDVLRRIDGGGMRVLRVTDSGRKADVFNFEVEGIHNYFVGGAGVLVHNESGQTSAPVGGRQEIFGIEIELKTSLFAPLLRRYFAHDDYSSSRDLSRWIPEKSPNARRSVDQALATNGISPHGLSWDEKISKARFGDLNWPTRTRTIILSYADYLDNVGQLKLREDIPAHARSIFEKREWKNDGTTMELVTSDNFDKHGFNSFDKIVPTAKEIVSLYPKNMNMNLDVLGPKMHVHFGTPGYSLETPAHGFSLDMTLERLNQGRSIFKSKHVTYNSVDKRGYVRLPDYTPHMPDLVLDRLEIRAWGNKNVEQRMENYIGRIRDPDILYEGLANRLLVSPSSLEVLSTYSLRTEKALRENVFALLSDPASSRYIEPALHSMRNKSAFAPFLDFVNRNDLLAPRTEPIPFIGGR
jgi:hypothetical protein